MNIADLYIIFFHLTHHFVHISFCEIFIE